MAVEEALQADDVEVDRVAAAQEVERTFHLGARCGERLLVGRLEQLGVLVGSEPRGLVEARLGEAEAAHAEPPVERREERRLGEVLPHHHPLHGELMVGVGHDRDVADELEDAREGAGRLADDARPGRRRHRVRRDRHAHLAAPHLVEDARDLPARRQTAREVDRLAVELVDDVEDLGELRVIRGVAARELDELDRLGARLAQDPFQDAGQVADVLVLADQRLRVLDRRPRLAAVGARQRAERVGPDRHLARSVGHHRVAGVGESALLLGTERGVVAGDRLVDPRLDVEDGAAAVAAVGQRDVRDAAGPDRAVEPDVDLVTRETTKRRRRGYACTPGRCLTRCSIS